MGEYFSKELNQAENLQSHTLVFSCSGTKPNHGIGMEQYSDQNKGGYLIHLSIRQWEESHPLLHSHYRVDRLWHHMEHVE